MILFPVLFVLSLVMFWALSKKLQTLFWKEWSTESQETSVLVKGVVTQQLRVLSPQNAVAQALVDYELKFKNLRSSLMMLCFQKVGVLLVGLMILLALHWGAIFAVLVLATIALGVAYKKPSKWIQVFLFAACFFGLFQGAFYQVSRVIFASTENSLAFSLADGRLFQFLILFGISVVVTFAVRFEFWSVFLAALLYFAGAVPVTNALALILGEQLAWALYWYLGARKSSRVSRTLFLEYLLLVSVAALSFAPIAMIYRGWGLLDISIFGSLVDKKILLLGVWGAWEIFLSFLLLLWGHFRSQSKVEESSELQPIQFPPKLLGVSVFGYKGWSFDQLQFRRQFMEQKVQRLQGHLGSLTAEERRKFPPGFLDKTQREVESLKSLLGSLPSDSV